MKLLLTREAKNELEKLSKGPKLILVGMFCFVEPNSNLFVLLTDLNFENCDLR